MMTNDPSAGTPETRHALRLLNGPPLPHHQLSCRHSRRYSPRYSRAAVLASLVVGLWLAAMPCPAPASPTAAAGGSGDDIDPSLCRALPTHRPAPDVEYVPGLDVRGNRVAPADLPGSHNALTGAGTTFDIPLTLNMARRFGFANIRTGGLPGTAEVGRLKIEGNRVLFNGQPVGGPQADALARYCGNR